MSLAAGVDVGGTKIDACIADPLTGEVITSAFTLDLLDVDVVGAFRELGRAAVGSDVRAAALAEARFGAGRGVDAPWLYVTVGTGISYSLVLGSTPFEGFRGNAIVVGAPPVELLASGLGLEATYRNAAVDAMRNLIEAEGTRDVPVAPAELGDLAGPLGAAIFGADRTTTASRA